MMTTVPVRSLTATEREGGAARWFYSSRVALVVVALLVSVPHPFATWWGGRTKGEVIPGLLIGLCWCVLGVWIRHHERRSLSRGELYSGLSLTLDVVALTALLSTSGAAQNPFTLLYFVPITLATVVAQKWTFRIAGLSVVGFALLVIQTARALEGHRHHAHHAHFFQHVQGMALALAVAGAFVTLFVHRIAQALAAQERRIVELSRDKQRDQYAIALGALSAGAAHELGSPLGSVQLLAEELPHLEGKERDEALQTIVTEVQRMKSIVHSMDSSELSAEILGGAQEWDLSELKSETEALGVEAEIGADIRSSQPKKIIAQILRELVRNALNVVEASKVRLSVTHSERSMAITVSDQGPGMSPAELQLAQEPFISHSGGTGLGLFLASVHARQLGGELELVSREGKGTDATLRLPLVPRTSGQPT